MDRNKGNLTPISMTSMSLSARRAWIEMFVNLRVVDGSKVALRKESVDRNHLFASSGVDFAVALRKESVDRNSL